MPQDIQELIHQSASFISGHQLLSGAIPWYKHGITDPWDHIECAIALDLSGRPSEAERAYTWLRDIQNHDGSWWYIVITEVGVNVNFYYNSVDETFDGNTCSNLYERIKRIGGHGNNNDWFIGNIDETRISNKARNQDWITTSYHTMNDPSSFMSFGPEETGP